MSGNQTLACVVSVTARAGRGRNEDAGAVAFVPRGGLQGVVVADGLGSYSQAGRAALLAVYEAVAWLRDRGEHFGRGGFTRLFADVHGVLRSYARELARGGDPEPRVFGTTLLVAVDTGGELAAAYAGNGAIWHIRGNLDEFPSATPPWNAVNLLNPHTVPRGGREALYNILDAAEERPPVPTVVSVSKDPRFGDILLLCTDGVSPAGQAGRGTGAGLAVIAIHQALRDLFAAWDGESDLPLRAALEGCLSELRDRGVLEDDATVGVLVTADALRYHRRARAANGARAEEIARTGQEGTPSPRSAA